MYSREIISPNTSKRDSATNFCNYDQFPAYLGTQSRDNQGETNYGLYASIWPVVCCITRWWELTTVKLTNGAHVCCCSIELVRWPSAFVPNNGKLSEPFIVVIWCDIYFELWPLHWPLPNVNNHFGNRSPNCKRSCKFVNPQSAVKKYLRHKYVKPERIMSILRSR